MNIAVILAGGTGTRVGAGRPKQFVPVLGKPILAYTCEIFQRNDRIDAIGIVCHPDWMDCCRGMVRRYALDKVQWLTPGGATFQESAMNGVARLRDLMAQKEVRGEDNVYLHYGCAPFTSRRIVDAVVEMTERRGSAVTGTPCYQLLSTRDGDSISKHWADRDGYIQIACPCGFRLAYLLEIYRKSEELGLLRTVEPHTTSLMYALGETVNYAYGDQTNIKITTAEDIDLFEGYVLMKRRRGESI